MLSYLAQNLAPDVPHVEDFRHHYNLFLSYYGSKGSPNPQENRRRPVEQTNQVYHLRAMMKLLDREQKEEKPQPGSLLPCLEYAVHRQILDVLSTLCQADVPPGLRPHIIRFFLFLVSQVDPVILPYVSVYLPIRRLLALFCSGKASPTESQEVNFIVALVTNLTKHPELLTLFAHQPVPGDISHGSSCSRTSSTMDLTLLPENLVQPSTDYDGRHILASAVINYMDSADYLIACQAMETLITVVSFDQETAAFDAVHGTDLCRMVAARWSDLLSDLDTLYKNKSFEVHRLEEIKVNWVEAHYLFRKENMDDFPGKAEIVAFLSWADYCDDLIEKSHPVISNSIVTSIEEEFFAGTFETALWPVDGDHPNDLSCFRVTLLSQIWLHINSDGLAKAFTRWLFGDHPELKGIASHPLKKRLVEFCLGTDDALALESLRLFDNLLDRPCLPVLESLILTDLQARGYVQNCLTESMRSWSDEEDEREKVRNLDAKTGWYLDEKSKKSPVGCMISGSCTMSPANIGKIVNSWLYLYPEELRSVDETISSSYEQYVVNAEAQVENMLQVCHGFGWPIEAVHGNDRPISEASSLDSKPEADSSRTKHFHEGDFLSMLFYLVEGMLEQSYDINLQLTAIISKLALLPHPNVHEFLLNPTIPLVESKEPRSLFKSMERVLHKAKRASETIPSLKKKIFACKKNLLGSPQIVSSPGGGSDSEFSLGENETRLIDALIVLEEFCKELAAVTLAKYRAARSEGL